MGKSYEGICQICGESGQLTDDHVPQKSLYPKSIRPLIIKMNSVKACPRCNNGSSEIDEFFKVIVGNIASASWDGELWNSVNATLDNNKRLDRLIEFHSKYEDIANQSGESKPTKVLKLENELKENFLLALDRIAKGLFYLEYKEVLVKDRVISIFHPEGLHPNKTLEINKYLSKSKWREVNKGTCRYVFVETDTTDIVFIIELYCAITLYYVIQRKKDTEPAV